MDNLINNQNNKLPELDNYLDLKSFLNFTLRNKKIISIYSLVTFILACLYSLTLKRVWEGEFQIVVNSNKDQSNNIQSSFFKNLPLGNFLDTNSNSLNTEVEVLQSPSVLMPIFDFVKIENEDYINKDLTFLNWKKKNLNINLKKGTSVLNITYKDTKKELILPVLNKISSAYQSYSGRNKRRNLELSKTYLKEQISLYKVSAINSLKKAQSFAIDQDLTILDIRPQNSIGSSNLALPNILNNMQTNNKVSQNSLIANVDIERARVEASNKIRKINLQISKIEDLNQDDEKIEFIVLTLPEAVAKGLPQELQKLDAFLLEKQSKYTDKDISVKRLKQKREVLIKLLQKKAISFLKAERLVAESQMEAAKRPKGIIIKYKELIREAGRNEETLIGLEDQLISLDLEKSKLQDPWELITKPTINKSPVAPSRKNIGFFGLIGGLFLGLIYSFIREKRSDIIYDEVKIEKILQSKIIEKISKKKLSQLTQDDLFINEFLNVNLDNEIVFIECGIDDSDKNLFEKLIKKNNKKYFFSNLIKNHLDKNSFIYFGYISKIKFEDVYKINRIMNLNNKKFMGVILIN